DDGARARVVARRDDAVHHARRLGDTGFRARARRRGRTDRRGRRAGGARGARRLAVSRAARRGGGRAPRSLVRLDVETGPRRARAGDRTEGAGVTLLREIVWPVEQAGAALHALATHCGLGPDAVGGSEAPGSLVGTPEGLSRWIDAVARSAGIALDPVE